MKKMRRCLSLLLVAALLFSAAPVGLLADLDIRLPDFSRFFSHTSHAATIVDSGTCGAEGDGSNLTWTLDSDGLLTISGTGKMKNYEDHSNPFFDNESVKKVVINDGVTCIGVYAFIYCMELTSVTIPNGVTTIGYAAFYGCTRLTSVKIPYGVTTIGYAAFEGCSSLTSVTLPNSLTNIGNNTFQGCKSLTNVTLPNSVTSIGNGAFSNCVSLTSMTFPSSVTSIGWAAFDSCTRLESVTIPNSVTSIGDGAFCNCTSLTSIEFPNRIISLGVDVFFNTEWYNMQSDGLIYTGKVAYKYKGAMSENTSVIIKEGTVGIAGGAFYNCTGLTSITIPDSIITIGRAAFQDTAWYDNKPDGLVYAGRVAYKYKGAMQENTYVKIKEGTVGIASGAFERYSALILVEIPDSVTIIGESAFYDCDNLKSVSIPNSVTSIGDSAFRRCSGLTSVSIPNSVTSIENKAFDDSQLKNVYYSGNEKEWESIAIGYDNTELAYATKHYNSTGPTVTYVANGGIGAPEKQNVLLGNDITISTITPKKDCTITYNASGGSVSAVSKNLNAVFQSWNTMQNGAGTSYLPGNEYKILNDITLYAQWTDPKAGDLPTPTRVGYVFAGWYTAASGGIEINKDSTITGNTTLYAQWTPCSHQWSRGVVTQEPTCTTVGEKAFTCTVCTATKTETVKATGHSYGAWTKLNDTQHQRVCANDSNHKETANHMWNSGVVTKAPTCTATGVRTYTCTVCKATKTETIKATGHSYGAWVKLNETQHQRTCSRCKAVEKASHMWNSGAVTKAPTCTAMGVRTYTCTVCKAIKTETISATGHSYGAWTKLNDTQHQRVCKNDKTHVLTENHAWDGGKITSQPNVTAAGTRTYTCTVCKGTRTETVYRIAYNANGGKGAPTEQIKTYGVNLTLCKEKPTKQFSLTYIPNGGELAETGKTLEVTFDAWNTKQDGTGVSYAAGANYPMNQSVQLYAKWTNPTAGELPTPTRSGYIFAGWYTAASGGTKITKDSVITKSQTLYAHWTAIPKNAYVITYNANGGTGTPASQTKTEGKALTLSTAMPSKTYLLSYNAVGGKVSPASKSVSVPFKNWNTKIDGTGTAYAPGGTYSKDASATLYAQWSNPKAGALATPTRSGYTFAGWYTAASGGTKITADSVITTPQTLYAHWTAAPEKNLYDLGEETYSFKNYDDSDSPSGHCFGMSMTSAGYYMGILDVGDIGLSSCQKLHTMTLTPKVKAPICLYQSIQGHYQVDAIVAGGKFYSNGYKWNYNVAEDWNAVLAYVKNHAYDHKGSLQVGIRNEEGGHAVNFLRYAKVDGQDRIYVYDNNFPNHESYLYLTAQGVMEAPVATFGKPVRCIVLRDVATYFELAKSYDASRVLYGAKDQLTVEGATFSYMEGSADGTEYVMYELPSDTRKVTIKPLADNADFIYMDVEYSFGEITDETYGVFRLADMREGAVVQEAQFTIYNGSAPAPSLPGDVSGDGEVTAEDARLALRAAVGLETYAAGSAEFLAADASHDGEITSEDARLILRAAVGLETLS